MSKKHFIALADALKVIRPSADNIDRVVQWEKTVTAIADVCESENHAFNRVRWVNYILGKCGPNGGRV